jgi:hypothetical protein
VNGVDSPGQHSVDTVPNRLIDRWLFCR